MCIVSDAHCAPVDGGSPLCGPNTRTFAPHSRVSLEEDFFELRPASGVDATATLRPEAASATAGDLQSLQSQLRAATDKVADLEILLRQKCQDLNQLETFRQRAHDLETLYGWTAAELERFQETAAAAQQHLNTQQIQIVVLEERLKLSSAGAAASADHLGLCSMQRSTSVANELVTGGDKLQLHSLLHPQLGSHAADVAVGSAAAPAAKPLSGKIDRQLSMPISAAPAAQGDQWGCHRGLPGLWPPGQGVRRTQSLMPGSALAANTWAAPPGGAAGAGAPQHSFLGAHDAATAAAWGAAAAAVAAASSAPMTAPVPAPTRRHHHHHHHLGHQAGAVGSYGVSPVLSWDWFHGGSGSHPGQGGLRALLDVPAPHNADCDIFDQRAEVASHLAGLLPFDLDRLDSGGLADTVGGGCGAAAPQLAHARSGGVPLAGGGGSSALAQGGALPAAAATAAQLSLALQQQQRRWHHPAAAQQESLKNHAHARTSMSAAHRRIATSPIPADPDSSDADATPDTDAASKDQDGGRAESPDGAAASAHGAAAHLHLLLQGCAAAPGGWPAIAPCDADDGAPGGELDAASQNARLRSKRDAAPNTCVYVGFLGWWVTERELVTAFSRFGELVSVRLLISKKSRRSREQAFVEYASVAAAGLAIQHLDGHDVTELVKQHSCGGLVVRFADHKKPAGEA